MLFKAIIFDLDGTLLDTLEDLADCMNKALLILGHPVRTLVEYRAFVGDGLTTLAERALPQTHRDRTTIERCVAAMRAEYSLRWAEKTRPYPGIKEMLAEVSSRHIPCGVVSNKHQDFTTKMVVHFFGEGQFACVVGAGTFPLKPDSAGTLYCANQLGAAPKETLYIGDSDIDMQTAHNAGMHAIGVLWGFRNRNQLVKAGADRLVAHPREIIAQISTSA